MKNTLICFFLAFLTTAHWSCKKNTTIEQPPAQETTLSDKKAFLSFGFKTSQNPSLKEDIAFTISNDTLYASILPEIKLSDLIAEFTFEGKSVTVNGVSQKSGVTKQNFEPPLSYIITAEDNSSKIFKVVIEVKLPVLNINTGGAAIESKENYITGHIKITGNASVSNSYEGTMRIRGRGNSTWGMAKKPYKIKLDQKASLLGMNSDKTWVLLANYADKTMMRNEIAFELSRRLGLTFTPQSRFVDLYLNNAYQGIYQLTEQIEVASHKVNIEEQEKNARDLPEIAGGYLLEVDGFAYSEPVYIQTPKGMPLTVHYPDAEDISNEQIQFITDYVNDFEQALFADNFTDPANGYRKYLDVDAFINYYLVNEIIGNPDAFWSTYLYKTRAGKLQAGPVWDFDIAANNDDRLGNAVNKLMLDAAHDPKAWISRLMEDESFRKAVKNRWNEVKSSKVNNITLFIDELSKRLNPSQKENFVKWNILNTKVYREPELHHTYQGEVKALRNFMERRIKWLDTQFQGPRFN
jgi:spore coat protein CotH